MGYVECISCLLLITNIPSPKWPLKSSIRLAHDSLSQLWGFLSGRAQLILAGLYHATLVSLQVGWCLDDLGWPHSHVWGLRAIDQEIRHPVSLIIQPASLSFFTWQCSSAVKGFKHLLLKYLLASHLLLSYYQSQRPWKRDYLTAWIYIHRERETWIYWTYHPSLYLSPTERLCHLSHS